jgi:sialate O-acetylesterase
MVLQRDMEVPVWGTAAPGEQVAVEFAGQKVSVAADPSGRWMTKLKPLAACAEPRDLKIGGTVIHDVLVGEVWIGSGQSNMEIPVSTFTGGDTVLAQAATRTYPQLRLLRWNDQGWTEATPANIQQFSALFFAFGYRLQKELNVPVGLVVGSLGGSASGRWVTEDMLRNDPACQKQIQEFSRTWDFDAESKKYDAELAAWTLAAEQAKQENKKAPGKPMRPTKAGEMFNHHMGELYEARVKPFIPYAIRSVLWDQGESGTEITGLDQFHLMGALIKGWRQAWGEDFPFIYMQKPSGKGTALDLTNPLTKDASKLSPLPRNVPGDGAFNTCNRAQFVKIQEYPGTAMVPTSDLGYINIHPPNKSAYGQRACLTALGFVYGRNIEYSGPQYASHVVEGKKVRIKFTHIGQGLVAGQSDKLQGFMVAGADKVFYWANATIEGDTVVVSSPEVQSPVAVRYAWANEIPWANLFDKDGFPALTFRTDDWPMPTVWKQ